MYALRRGARYFGGRDAWFADLATSLSTSQMATVTTVGGWISPREAILQGTCSGQSVVIHPSMGGRRRNH